MRRADRKTSSDDNAIKDPYSPRPQPASIHELKTLLSNARVQRDEWKQRAQENEEAAHQLVHVQQEFQLNQNELHDWQERAKQNHQLYLTEQQNYRQTFFLYQEEQGKTQSFITLYNEAQAQSQHYLSLYNEAQTQLSFERHSKAGIKGWETRRKRENQRLKQEIGEMTVLLRESLARKEEAVSNLYVLAGRMERIQQLVDSVEEEPANSPITFLQKLKRIWQALKEILEE